MFEDDTIEFARWQQLTGFAWTLEELAFMAVELLLRLDFRAHVLLDEYQAFFGVMDRFARGEDHHAALAAFMAVCLWFLEFLQFVVEIQRWKLAPDVERDEMALWALSSHLIFANKNPIEDPLKEIVRARWCRSWSLQSAGLHFFWFFLAFDSLVPLYDSVLSPQD